MSENYETYIKLQVNNGAEYIIDSAHVVHGPSGIAKWRIQYHVIIGELQYKGPSSGFPLSIIASQFQNKEWIKVIECKPTTDEEDKIINKGRMIY